MLQIFAHIMPVVNSDEENLSPEPSSEVRSSTLASVATLTRVLYRCANYRSRHSSCYARTGCSSSSSPTVPTSLPVTTTTILGHVPRSASSVSRPSTTPKGSACRLGSASGTLVLLLRHRALPLLQTSSPPSRVPRLLLAIAHPLLARFTTGAGSSSSSLGLGSFTTRCSA